MSYLVLARKFRPQTFASVVGQEHITKALANAIVRGKVAHAFLFTGPRGVGKTSTARVLARAINCTGRPIEVDLSKVAEADARESIEPCGECSNCREIAKSSSMAVWEIDGASNNSVDNVRELIDSLRSMPPAGSRYKIYIIDEVHMLSTAAFNALLKSLEEPPPHTIFVFATTEPHKIPETVISRCQRYDFHKLALDTIIEQLREIAQGEGISADEEVFEFIARKAEGGMRDAQTLLDRLNAFSSERISLAEARQVFGVVGRELFFALSDAVLKRDPQAGLLLLDQAFEQSLDLRAFVTEFLSHFRNLLLVGVQAEGPSAADDKELRRLIEVSADELSRLKSSVTGLSTFDLQRLFDLAQRTADQALASNFPRYVLEAGVTKMATLADLQPLPKIISRLESALRESNGSSHTGAAPARAARPGPTRAAVESATSNIERPPVVQPVELAAVREEEEPGTFDGNWSNFANHVRSRSELMLAALLRRVTPTEFALGQLTIHAGKFDLATLKDAKMLQGLRTCLHSYSRVAEWQIRLEEAAEGAKNAAPSGLAAQVEVTPVRARADSRADHLPGSLAHGEMEKERQRVSQIESEARAQPLVQSALSTFAGSKIEKVSPLKR